MPTKQPKIDRQKSLTDRGENFKQNGVDADDDNSDWEEDRLNRKRRNMSIRGKPKKHNEHRTKVFFFSLLI